VIPGAESRDAFVARYGGVYEASPWVAELVWPAVSAGVAHDLETLAEAMRAIVDLAPKDRRLALVRAHPELASRAKMADSSVREQAGAGLDACSPAEFEAFQGLNGAYNARFGFPFIVAVKGMSRADILAAFVSRLANSSKVEFETALAQIHRIARFRLEDLV
jgi:2-oxo-4-hydroxy-4-carboxy-5-ureidoimidazoline decarboxylase